MEERNFRLLWNTFVDNARLARERYDHILELRKELSRMHEEIILFTYEAHRLKDDVNKLAKRYA